MRYYNDKKQTKINTFLKLRTDCFISHYILNAVSENARLIGFPEIENQLTENISKMIECVRKMDDIDTIEELNKEILNGCEIVKQILNAFSIWSNILKQKGCENDSTQIDAIPQYIENYFDYNADTNMRKFNSKYPPYYTYWVD